MRIVIVADPLRKDFYDYLVENLATENEMFFLWDYEFTGIDYPYSELVHPLFWSSFKNSKKLIDEIKPDKIIFFEIIDFWQISLIISCHHFKIATFFVEHGVGNSTEQVISRFNEIPPVLTRIRKDVNKLFFSINQIIKGRIFFFAALAYLTSSERIKFLLLMLYFKRYTPLHALSLIKFRKRTPHFAILFNRNNIDPFLLYNEIEDENIYTGGVPMFDKFFRISNYSHRDHIVFIEHPYLEEGILDWTDKFHEKIARSLESFSILHKKRVVVKLHPRSNIDNWKRYNLDALVEIRQREDIMEDLASAEMILGYSSTLLNVMIACKRNIVLLGWHPAPKVFGDDFSKSNLCHLSLSPEDLQNKYLYWKQNNLTAYDKAYEQFLEEYCYPFDGNATKRIIDFILQTEVRKG